MLYCLIGSETWLINDVLCCSIGYETWHINDGWYCLIGSKTWHINEWCCQDVKLSTRFYIICQTTKGEVVKEKNNHQSEGMFYHCLSVCLSYFFVKVFSSAIYMLFIMECDFRLQIWQQFLGWRLCIYFYHLLKFKILQKYCLFTSVKCIYIYGWSCCNQHEMKRQYSPHPWKQFFDIDFFFFFFFCRISKQIIVVMM